MPFLPFYANANTCGEVTRLLNKAAIQGAFSLFFFFLACSCFGVSFDAKVNMGNMLTPGY